MPGIANLSKSELQTVSKRRQPVIIARQAGQTKSAVKVITDNQTVKEKVPQHYIRVKPQSAVLIYQSEMSNLNSEKSNN